MLCEKCGAKSATTHIRTVVNGVICERHLCNECAVSLGYVNTNSNNLTQMLSSMFGGTVELNENKVTTCAQCGLTINEIINNGKCGCAQCYSTFYDKLIPYIKKAQYGRQIHKGKIPNCKKTDVKPNDEKIMELKILLKKLVDAEKYEEAALVRDKIKLLEEEML